MDLATIIGLGLAFFAVFGGFVIEGGHLAAVMQPTAALIVIGGTIGAIFVQFTLISLKKTALGIKDVFLIRKSDPMALVTQLVAFAQKARREGVVALESDAETATDPFLKKALGLAVDGSDARVIREAMEVEMGSLEEESLTGAKVFEAAGGYSPTLGILGAVLGLIHVMQNLADPGKLGAGIAVAFVATVYGLVVANVICLPMAGKLKSRCETTVKRCELILTGVVAIVEGDNPRIIEEKLNGFVGADAAKAGADVVSMRKAA